MKIRPSTIILFFAILILPACVFFLFSHSLSQKKNVVGIPQRIVSLSPSITRMIDDMDKGKSVIGVTSFDRTTPERTVVGSLVSPNNEAIMILKPDLIILSSEDSAVQKIETLDSAGIPCLVLPATRTFTDMLDTYIRLSKILSSDTGAQKALLYKNRYATRSAYGITTLFLVSHTPFIAASTHSFIGAIVSDAGGTLVSFPGNKPYPPLSREFIITSNPDCIITSDPGGTSDLEKHLASFRQLSSIRNKTIFSLSPEMACYYTPKDYLDTLDAIVKMYSSMRKTDK